MKMLCAFVSERRNDVMVRVVILEAAFLTDPSGFVVPLIVSAPYSIEFKVIEAS